MRTSSDPLPSDHDSVDCLGCVPRPLCVPPHVSPLLSKAVLPNGLRVFLLEDHEVPLVRGTLVMRGGRYASPQDKVRGVLVMRGGPTGHGEGGAGHEGRTIRQPTGQGEGGAGDERRPVRQPSGQGEGGAGHKGRTIRQPTGQGVCIGRGEVAVSPGQ